MGSGAFLPSFSLVHRRATLFFALVTAACVQHGVPSDNSTDTSPSHTTDATIDTVPSDTSEDVTTVDSIDVALPDAGTDAMVSDSSELVRRRPYAFVTPSDYDPSRPLPLLIVLHGYSGNAAWQEMYFSFSQLVHTRRFLYALPEGTIDRRGNRFWNATDACCDFDRTGVDDVAYLAAVIDDMSARYRVDPRRVFVVGHSNGGFMAHRLACDLSQRIAAIVSLAGANWYDPTRCTPSEPVAVLQVHGTSDEIVYYAGGTLPISWRRYPGAMETIAAWARRNHCNPTLSDTGPLLDLDTVLPGAETRVQRHMGCTGGAAELWTITGGRHIPNLQRTWATTIYDWLMAHPKP